MSPTFSALLLLAAYFVYMGWSERMTHRSGAVPDRRYPSMFATIASVFTVVGAGEYALSVDLVSAFGFWGPSLFAGLGLALVLVGRLAPRVRRLFAEHVGTASTYDKYLSFTTPDVFFVQCGSSSAKVSTAICALAFLGILWLQLILGGKLIANVADVGYPVAVMFLAVVVGTYVALGGFAAIFRTDVFQGVIMWVSLYAVVIYIFFIRGDTAMLSDTLNQIGVASRGAASGMLQEPTALTIMIITVVAAVGGPDLWQRINMVKSDKVAVRSAHLASAAMFVFILPLLLLAVDAVQVVGSTVNEEIFVAYTAVLGQSSGPLAAWPTLLQIFFAVGLLGAFLSTADTSAMLIASTVGNERRRRKEVSEVPNAEVIWIVWVVVALGGILAVFVTDAAAAFTAVLGILAAQGVPFVLAVLGRGNGKVVTVALLVGGALAIAQAFVLPSQYNEGYYLLLPAIPGIACAFSRASGSRAHG